MVEKLRAIAGQRRFAVSRDLYDIYHLVNAGIRLDDALPLVPVKFAARGVDLQAIAPTQFQERKSEFELDWQKRLSYLIADQNAASFADAWQVSMHLLTALKEWVEQESRAPHHSSRPILQRLRQVARPNLLALLGGHGGEVYNMDWSPDGKWLAAAEGRWLFVWDVASSSLAPRQKATASVPLSAL